MESSRPILYSFCRCPYAIRARLAILLGHKNVILREVLLSNKPSQLIEISKKATVPVLVIEPNKVLHESLDIMLWALADSSDKEVQYIYQSQHDELVKKLIALNDGPFKFHLDRFKYSNHFPDENKEYHLHEARKILCSWNTTIKIKEGNISFWLAGENKTLADLAIWPFVRQFRNVDPIAFESEPSLSNLNTWLSKFTSARSFTTLMTKSKPWQPGESTKFFPPS